MFQQIWENKYKAGEGLNRYPWDYVVSFIYNNRPSKPLNSQIRILEVGFGAGGNLWFCAREGFDVYGVEGSVTACDYAKKWFEAEGLKADLREGSFEKLPFQDNFFDIVIDRASLTCVSSSSCKLAVSEISRVLQPKGIFLFTPYSKDHTSYKTGVAEENGLVRVVNGSIVNAGLINFYDFNDIKLMISDTGLSMVSCEHWVKTEILNNQNHCEWHVVLKKGEDENR